MTNYNDSSAYDLSLFEPQQVQPRRTRETEPVRRQQVKKAPQKKSAAKKSVKKTAKKSNNTYTRTQPVRKTSSVKKAINTVDSYQHTVDRESKNIAVSPIVVKGIVVALCLFSVLFTRLFMFAEGDKLDAEIVAMQNKISIAESENVRLNAELNSMIDTQKTIEYAETKLGMVKAENYQITYIDLSEGDEFVVAGDKEVDGKGEFADGIMSLFAYIF